MVVRIVGMVARCRAVALLLLLLSSLLPVSTLGAPNAGAVVAEDVGAAPADARYFAETGHYVIGRFREYWESHGGLLTIGLPLTTVFPFASTDGKTYQVQYFERAVLEYHPENAAPYDVLLTQIGRELASARGGEVAFQPVARSNDPEQTYFAETSHHVGPVFLDYWRRNGGLQNFGYPLSELISERNDADGKTYLVLYFERARFEYHPEFANTDYVVLLGQIGRERMHRVNVPTSARSPEAVPPTAGPGVVAAPTAGAIATTFLGVGNSSTGYPFLKGPTVALGVQGHYFGQDIGRLTGMLKDVGFTWTKQQVVWKDIEGTKGNYAWGQLDEIVDRLRAQNVAIMLSVVKSPRWATPTGTDDGTPRDPQDFGDFMRAITSHYKGKVAAYELWNEANLAAETGNRVNAGFYVEMLKAGYLGVKGADANCIVVLGALSPTGVNNSSIAVDDTIYLEQLYQYKNGEVRNYFDVLGAHPYGMANPPDTLWSDGKPGPVDKFVNHDSFYFRRFESHYAIMKKHGDGDKQVWLTEWGWGSDVRTDGTQGYAEFDTVTEQMRADYVTGAIIMMRQRYPYMGATFLWNLNWAIIDQWYSGPAHYCIINADYTPRPVYNALKALPK